MENSASISSSFYTKNRLAIHVSAWLAYYIFWVAISGGPSVSNLFINVIFLVAQIAAVYATTSFLMPKLLYKKRFIIFIFLMVLSVFVCAALLLGGLRLYQEVSGNMFGDFFTFPNFLGPTLGSVGTSLVVGLVAKLIKDNYHNERKAKALETENLQQEIKFLKSQLDPHFLFNALNNIYWQIKKDPTAAADSLAKFSDMLRYQLYDCNTEKISLQQEVDYLINYLDVAKLGYDDEVEIRMNISDQINGEMISPLLLIPFAENAIKHLGTVDQDCYIDFDLSLEQGKLSYSVSNTKSNETTSTDELRSSGIGLENIKRRLNLLYPEQHSIQIQEGEHNYEAKLELTL